MGKYLIALAVCAATPVLAEDLRALACTGNAPDWRLAINGDTAFLTFARRIELEIPHRTSAEGRDWPHALTLIGETDTAILILDARDCGGDPFTALLLTQRGQTPIILAGCCAQLP